MFIIFVNPDVSTYGQDMGEMRSECKILLREPKRKRPLRRPMNRSEDNIKTDIKENELRMWTAFIWLRISFNGRLL
jgi:hypothetical protein